MTTRAIQDVIMMPLERPRAWKGIGQPIRRWPNLGRKIRLVIKASNSISIIRLMSLDTRHQRHVARFAPDKASHRQQEGNMSTQCQWDGTTYLSRISCKVPAQNHISIPAIPHRTCPSSADSIQLAAKSILTIKPTTCTRIQVRRFAALLHYLIDLRNDIK